jgi:4a-hydroxytetrahydrobiopterin dehydratase
MTEATLQQKTCVPCRGGIPPLPAGEVARLLSGVPGWRSRDDDTRIEAQFRFEDFRAALDFVQQVGELAEREFHHPDWITFGWGHATIVLRTKKIKGLHENDFILAAKINEIARPAAAEPDS